MADTAEVILIISQDDRLKRITPKSLDEYEDQYLIHRRSLKLQDNPIRQKIDLKQDEDRVKQITTVEPESIVCFFYNDGTVSFLDGRDLKSKLNNNTAYSLDTLFDHKNPRELVEAIGIRKDEYKDYQYLIIGTLKGRVQKINIKNLNETSSPGKSLVDLENDDELISAKLANIDEFIVLVSDYGYCVRFSINDLPVREIGKKTLKGLSLITNDALIAMDVGKEDSRLITIGTKKDSYGPAYDISDLRMLPRGGEGLILFKPSRNNKLQSVKITDNNKPFFNEHLYLFSQLGGAVKWYQKLLTIGSMFLKRIFKR